MASGVVVSLRVVSSDPFPLLVQIVRDIALSVGFVPTTWHSTTWCETPFSLEESLPSAKSPESRSPSERRRAIWVWVSKRRGGFGRDTVDSGANSCSLVLRVSHQVLWTLGRGVRTPRERTASTSRRTYLETSRLVLVNVSLSQPQLYFFQKG